MSIFNLKKKAEKVYTITDKTIEENRNKMGLSNSKQGVTEKNINFSLPVKNKDNTIPFNAQLEAERKNKTEQPIIEASMDKKEIDFNSKDKKQITDINVESQKYDDKKTEAFKKSQKKETNYWDKYVGVQLEGEGQPTQVDNNIPDSASQLGNKPERFKDNKIDKLVMASLKDADAMIFHIYATAAKQSRELNQTEKQQIVDINSGKMRLFSQVYDTPVQPVLGDITIMQNSYGKWLVYEEGGGGEPIDQFDDRDEAVQNYPEGEVING